ncbi:lens fiber major intrinsic protein-like isoform X1 [Colias croceus]|uniref:lens fiber major intrinsic protein-like isoform X1 n=1 Tax=Colias crocea TaxID=72248 RepID=UPI001E27AC85|nr:lens fiber major intrinsic protein-like isoform X1 [Colias croceus]
MIFLFSHRERKIHSQSIYIWSPIIYRNIHKKYAGRGAAGWVARWWRALLAELVATALLVLLGVATMLSPGAPLTHPALAFGFVVLANIEAFGPASGAHMNPAVTLAAVLAGRLPAPAALAYVLAQLLGAVLGFAALMALAPGSFADASVVVGGTTPTAVGPLAAAAVEALLTGLLALLCCGLWTAEEEGKQDPTVSIKFGLTVAGLIYAGGPLTGASLNPARSFAPALLQHFTADHWVYWVGPLGGAALATLLHRFALRPPRAAPARPLPETLPLHDKPDC